MLLIRAIAFAASATLLSSVVHADPCVPTKETCNGLDDDCDGVRDGISESCFSHAAGCTKTPTGWSCTGVCEFGTRTCSAQLVGSAWVGTWSPCIGDVGPTIEICDGLDNDCNGIVDDGAPCPGTSQCVNGSCEIPSKPCGRNADCPAGQICSFGKCGPSGNDPCATLKCPTGSICKAGTCIDPCTGVTCGKLEKCVLGQCVDNSCYSVPCPSGYRCVAGQCAKDPCANVVCQDPFYCDDGQCRGRPPPLPPDRGCSCSIVGVTTASSLLAAILLFGILLSTGRRH